MGTLYNQVHGKIEFRDEANDIYGFYEIGNVKQRSQEYFEGLIYQNGKQVSDVFGNYCGYVDFNGLRYFDVRRVKDVFKVYQDLPENESLPSDSTKRLDLVLLAANALDSA